MTFRWGGLIDYGDATQQPPADAEHARSSIEVLGYDRNEISRHDNGSVLISTVLTERFTGVVDGMGRADHIRLIYPDGSDLHGHRTHRRRCRRAKRRIHPDRARPRDRTQQGQRRLGCPTRFRHRPTDGSQGSRALHGGRRRRWSLARRR